MGSMGHPQSRPSIPRVWLERPKWDGRSSEHPLPVPVVLAQSPCHLGPLLGRDLHASSGTNLLDSFD